ncbi:uncharacterized protein BDR25DRAFT_290911 [Lindgomyces ingoldianus]|uniref:Uncharacterized protein n=1 Tax=Lindgomyces ingoldianus TaxID=673940 RepID=A0ACB6QMS2_9PLEO|nr:uncharacterized protein BDR25DRAFT_290911 [Lindgomyces ingoldianus]KAF2468211.1 hypothetical protein BDR25DRAFT_290911 [Lindgomyces ingoldianus]
MTSYDDYGMPVGAYSEPESLGKQALRVARAFVLYRIKPAADKKFHALTDRNWSWRGILSLVRILIAIWFVTLYWGERSAFNSAIGSCRWESWEKWGIGANPHRLVFVADPQLIDPHTYPDRPWPLNALTIKHTDLYLRRAYSRIQKVLYPDSAVFLGDFFDGGREWSTRTTTSPEERYRKYGESFWLKEYDRFGSIFFGHWQDGGTEPRPGQPGRKIISSLPGNHDLGFGKGIQVSVRKRFNAYFGEGNRIDIIGNHTLVSVDTVSLSALGQENPVEGLWKPAMDFLDNVKAQKGRLVREELRKQQGLRPNLLFLHDILDAGDLAKAELPHFGDSPAEFPTILLSHVPLYRDPGTPCGPLREHWPPTRPPKGQTEPLEKDDRNAISVSGGYQYQNVLDREITKVIAEKVGNIQYAFSGDDHDYCEVLHRAYPSAGSGIREITVKSISWAMGVRYPGFVMLSLWNPVDASGNPLRKDSNAPTLQTHLCLLPDQLGIFIRYITLVGITILSLIVRAALVATGRISTVSHNSDIPLLPVTEHGSSAENEKAALSSSPPESTHITSSSNSSSSSEPGNKLQIRSSSARTRSTSPNGSYELPVVQSKYTYPLIQHAGYYIPDKEEPRAIKTWGSSSAKKSKSRKKGLALFFHEFKKSFLTVAIVVFAWYFWLIWHG